MRAWVSGVSLVFAIAAAACGGNGMSPMPSSSSMPSMSPTSAPATMAGSWVGMSSDSTGSMMGAGLTPSMMAGTTWVLTQNGSTFTGTMQFPGNAGGMTVAGTLNGHTGTFTMTGQFPMMSRMCTATASGTFDMDDAMTQMHATYSGTNSCTGPFDHGDITLHR